jgi:hypothetical protein
MAYQFTSHPFCLLWVYKKLTHETRGQENTLKAPGRGGSGEEPLGLGPCPYQGEVGYYALNVYDHSTERGSDQRQRGAVYPSYELMGTGNTLKSPGRDSKEGLISPYQQ